MILMKRAVRCWSVAVLFSLPLSIPCALDAQQGVSEPDSARIITRDIPNFWKAYDGLPAARTRDDSLRVVRQEYLESASPGLEAFFRLRIQSADNILRALERMPRYYAAMRTNTLNIGRVEPRIREGYRQFRLLYPAVQFPDLYFLIGVFASSGTFTDEGLLLGAEMIAADETAPRDELPVWAPPADTSASAIACLAIHELVHVQQDYARGRFLLAQSLREGVANFLARLTVGCTGAAESAYSYGVAHERELWDEFRQQMTGAYDNWLYNGHTSKDRPGDLGYFMGDRIAQAYYDRAAEKRQAIYDMLHIKDYGAFLEASGYGEKWER